MINHVCVVQGQTAGFKLVEETVAYLDRDARDCFAALAGKIQRGLVVDPERVANALFMCLLRQAHISFRPQLWATAVFYRDRVWYTS